MSSIKETLDSALPSGAQAKFSREYDAVLDALTEREYDITDKVVAAVVANTSFSKEQVEAQAQVVGLAVRPAPEPEPEPEVEAPAAESGDDDRLTKLEAAVARLTELAERHLGARR